MSLLRDIQNAAVDPSTDITTLLRKCKILAARLGNEDFKKWVDNELNGYKKIEDLPQYRIIHTGSYGHFAGLFGRVLKNAPIPPACLPEKFRDKITKAYLMHPISAYVSLIDNKGEGDPQEPWPADMTVLFSQKIYEDMTCLSAWKSIPFNALEAVVDTIKTRVLSFVLEIESEYPDAGEASQHQPPLSQEKVAQVFNTYISGNVQNVATGSTNVTQAGEFHVTAGDFSALSKYLESYGVSNKDIEDLKSAIDSDKETGGKIIFGKRAQAWLAKMVGKAASGVWEIGTSVATAELGKALSAYFGLQ